MEKKYKNDELEEDVNKFWSEYQDLVGKGGSEYAAVSIAFDNFIEKIGWKFTTYGEGSPKKQ